MEFRMSSRQGLLERYVSTPGMIEIVKNIANYLQLLSQPSRGSLAYTDYEPESVENRDSPFYAGMRNVTICPKFWTEARTKRHIPEDRSPNKDEFCGTHKSRRLKPKKVIDFETAG